MSLNLLLENNLKDNFTNFVFYNNEKIYFNELYLKIKSFEKTLIKNQVVNLGIMIDNSLEWIIADLSSLFLNITCVPIPLFFNEEQRQNILNDATIDYIYDGKDLIKTNINPKKHSFSKITYTSGTTSNPKGVCLSENNILNSLYAINDRINLITDSHLNILPFSTLLENLCGIYLPILRKSNIFTFNLNKIGFDGYGSFHTDVFKKLIEEHNKISKIETAILLPEILRQIYNSNDFDFLKSFKYLTVGGGKVNTDILNNISKLGINIYEGYGLSECCSVVSLNSNYRNKIGSVGKPLSHVNVEIIDGEIVVSGNSMSGYLNQSEHNDKIYTGDNGFLDDDGYLYVLGRKKNIIVSGYGRNINPEWIEETFKDIKEINNCVLIGNEEQELTLIIDSSYSPEYFIDSILIKNKTLPFYAQVKHFSYRELESIKLKSGKINRSLL